MHCVNSSSCLTWNDGEGYDPARSEIDPSSGLCAACLLDRAIDAIDSCTLEDEARDDRALTVLVRALRAGRREPALRLMLRQVAEEREQDLVETLRPAFLRAVGGAR